MSNKSTDVRAKCPFYLSESALRIRCEGAVGAETVSIFGDSADKDGHFERYCATFRFARCPLYELLATVSADHGERGES